MRIRKIPAPDDLMDYLKVFLENNDQLPIYSIIAERFGVSESKAGAWMTDLGHAGLIKRNRCGGWMITRTAA